jgi:hypothetical protein
MEQIPEDKGYISVFDSGTILHKFKDDKGREVTGYLDDADTLVTPEKDYRFGGGFDAAEVGKFAKSGAFSAGSKMGEVQTRIANELIPLEGFNRVTNTGASSWGRDVSLFTRTGGGEDYGTFAMRNDLATPTDFTPQSVMDARAFTRFNTAMNRFSEKTPIDKARDIVDDTLRGGSVISKVQANTIEDYQDYLGSTSYKGLDEQDKAILALEERIQSPKISDRQRNDYKLQLENMKENFQRNMNAPRNIFINSIEGQNAKWQGGTWGELGRAMDRGTISVRESANNIMEYLGDVAGSKDTMAKAQINNQDLERERRVIDLRVGDRDITGGTLTRWKDVKEDPTRLFQMIGNTILEQGPLMGVMVGGSMAGALVGAAGGPAGVFAGSMAIPMLIGIGDVYGEMPDDEKNITVATAAGMAIGLVDRFGIDKAALRGVDFMTKEGRDIVARKIASASNGKYSYKEATELLAKGIKDMGTEYATMVRYVATQQLASKKGVMNIIDSIARQSGKEAATEAVQEAMQYGAVTASTTQDFNWTAILERMEESAVAGGILGGTLHTPGAMFDRSKFNHELNKLSGVETQSRTQQSMMSQEETVRNGKMLNDIELSKKVRGYNVAKDSTGRHMKLSDFIQPGHENSMARDAAGLATNGGIFAPSRDNLMSKFMNSVAGREIAGLLDTKGARGIYTGLSAFKRIHQIANSVMSILPTHSDKRVLFKTDNTKDIGVMLNDSLNNGSNHPGSLQYRKILDQVGKDLATELFELDKMGDNSGWRWNEVNQPDYFLKNQPVHPTLVAADEANFLKDLMAHYKSSGFVASAPNSSYFKDLVDRIKENFTHREMTELRDMGILDNPAFNKYKSTDVEQNVVRMVEAISRSAVRNTIFGKNGEVLAKGVAKMIEDGDITAQEGSLLALGLKQQMDMFDGRLNKSKSPLIRGATENATFVSMLVYMDTSLFANLSEIVFGAMGMTPKNAVKYFGIVGKTFAKDLAAKLTQLGSYITKGRIKAFDEATFSLELDLLQQTGHAGRMNDIAFNVGANIQTQAKRNMSGLMFKLNLVESATNAARAARASIASDEFSMLISVLAESPNTNDLTRWARDRLQYYRVDPDEAMKLYKEAGGFDEAAIAQIDITDPVKEKLLKDIGNLMSVGTANFIDEFSSRPEPGSSAKLLDDHRFILFTQFKRFTWHFTSNVVPQLWNMYLKRGAPEYSYSAFSLIMVAFAAAYAGMYLKAALRGEDDEDDDKMLAKRLQQSFDYSVGQAPSDMFASLSKLGNDMSKFSVKDPLRPITNQSAALGVLSSTGKDLYGVATKDNDEAEKTRLIQRIPVFGEIPGIRNFFEKENDK